MDLHYMQPALLDRQQALRRSRIVAFVRDRRLSGLVQPRPQPGLARAACGVLHWMGLRLVKLGLQMQEWGALHAAYTEG